jgi:catechol 2,3-dioxygenase-like lactoylglutathione lyase family enzyme
MSDEWPKDLPVAQVRFARPTDKLKEVVAFYRDGLGLEEIGSFTGHARYSGVMLGLPGQRYHLEFTEHEEGSPCPAPTKDNLLVFYVPNRNAFNRVAARFARLGYNPVMPENPYWKERGLTYEDPDGWRVVLMNTAGI